MDYIYGKLNFEVKKVEYKGTTTETTKTTVVTSGEANEISVDVLKVPNALTVIDNFDESEVVFDGSSDKTITIPLYSMLKTPVPAEENYAEYQLTRNGEPVGDKIIFPKEYNIDGGIWDILKYASLAEFPLIGEEGKSYIALDTGFTYHWSGSMYVLIASQEVEGGIW